MCFRIPSAAVPRISGIGNEVRLSEGDSVLHEIEFKSRSVLVA